LQRGLRGSLSCPRCGGDLSGGHWPGWIPVGEEPDSRWIREAYDNSCVWDDTETLQAPPLDGAYEACGPRIGANAETLSQHVLIRHGDEVLELPIRSAEAIRHYLEQHPMEGVVFHHPDGRMCKIRRADFGLPWPVKR
jgi:hypothetical protein